MRSQRLMETGEPQGSCSQVGGERGSGGECRATQQTGACPESKSIHSTSSRQRPPGEATSPRGGCPGAEGFGPSPGQARTSLPSSSGERGSTSEGGLFGNLPFRMNPSSRQTASVVCGCQEGNRAPQRLGGIFSRDSLGRGWPRCHPGVLVSLPQQLLGDQVPLRRPFQKRACAMY